MTDRLLPRTQGRVPAITQGRAKRRCALALSCAMACAATAPSAQTQADVFYISTYAENENDSSQIANLADTFSRIAPRTSGAHRPVQLQFMSATGLIENGRATPKLLANLQKGVADLVATIEFDDATQCSASQYEFRNADFMLILHHSQNADEPEDAHRCFVGSLRTFHTDDTTDKGTQFTLVDWRTVYADLLTSLANGQPAYAGIAPEEN